MMDRRSQIILDGLQRWLSRLWPLYLALLALVWAALVIRPALMQHGHISSDWLIDYRFGFVRRGLSGELFWSLQQLTDVSALYWVAGVQFVAFVTLLGGLWWLTRTARVPLSFWLLAFSPATLAFSFFSEFEAGRKEVVLFALCAAFAVWLTQLKRNAVRRVPLWALPAWGGAVVVGVLMHELIAFYVPWMVWMLWRTESISRSGRWALSATLLAAAMGTLAMLMAWGGPLDGSRFCRAFVDDGMSASLCRGTLVFPLTAVNESIANTRLLASQFNYVGVYGAGLLLALLPAGWMAFAEGWRPSRRTVWAVGGCVALTIPLFVLALDWGRFIQIHLVLGLIACAMSLRAGAAASAPAVRPKWRLWVFVAALAGLALWDLPVCCESGVGRGVLGQALRLMG